VLDLLNKWNKVTDDPAQFPVMVTTDEVLVHLKTDSAFHLIHYTIPAVQYKFNYRMSSVLGTVPNKFAKVTKSGLTNQYDADVGLHDFVGDSSQARGPSID
jgi:hypothetical protein